MHAYKGALGKVEMGAAVLHTLCCTHNVQFEAQSSGIQPTRTHYCPPPAGPSPCTHLCHPGTSPCTRPPPSPHTCPMLCSTAQSLSSTVGARVLTCSSRVNSFSSSSWAQASGQRVGGGVGGRQTDAQRWSSRSGCPPCAICCVPFAGMLTSNMQQPLVGNPQRHSSPQARGRPPCPNIAAPCCPQPGAHQAHVWEVVLQDAALGGVAHVYLVAPPHRVVREVAGDLHPPQLMACREGASAGLKLWCACPAGGTLPTPAPLQEQLLHREAPCTALLSQQEGLPASPLSAEAAPRKQSGPASAPRRTCLQAEVQ